MTSRERILAALRREPVDYLPCSIYFNHNLKVAGYDLTDWKDHARLQIDLGCDPVVHFEYLWPPPTAAGLAAAGEGIATALRFAQTNQLAAQGYGGHGLATSLFVMGAQNTVLFAVDHPEAFHRLAQIDSRANIERIRLCAKAPEKPLPGPVSARRSCSGVTTRSPCAARFDTAWTFSGNADSSSASPTASAITFPGKTHWP